MIVELTDKKTPSETCTLLITARKLKYYLIYHFYEALNTAKHGKKSCWNTINHSQSFLLKAIWTILCGHKFYVPHVKSNVLSLQPK